MNREVTHKPFALIALILALQEKPPALPLAILAL
jgi:hypothetical protein